MHSKALRARCSLKRVRPLLLVQETRAWRSKPPGLRVPLSGKGWKGAVVANPPRPHWEDLLQVGERDAPERHYRLPPLRSWKTQTVRATNREQWGWKHPVQMRRDPPRRWLRDVGARAQPGLPPRVRTSQRPGKPWRDVAEQAVVTHRRNLLKLTRDLANWPPAADHGFGRSPQQTQVPNSVNSQTGEEWKELPLSRGVEIRPELAIRALPSGLRREV